MWYYQNGSFNKEDEKMLVKNKKYQILQTKNKKNNIFPKFSDYHFNRNVSLTYC